MLRGANRKMSGLLVALAVLGLPGCITIQAIEPVIPPPAPFKGDASVAVEFAQPGSIGFRCAERGAKFFGMPGINSGACADSQLLTMIDPCSTVTAGPYAKVLCDSLKLHRQETRVAIEVAAETAPAKPAGLTKIAFAPGARTPVVRASSPPSPWESVKVEFVAASTVEMRCAERGAKMHDAGENFVSCGDRLLITVSNPCDLEETGWYARTLCHEMAHVNGWASDHPTHGPLATIRLASESPQAVALAALQAAPTSQTYLAAAGAAGHDVHVDAERPTSAGVIQANVLPAGDDRQVVEARITALAQMVRNAAEPIWIRARGLLAAVSSQRSAPWLEASID